MKIVQIGIGKSGKNHARILSDLGILSAICDIDKESETYPVNHYKSLDKLLDSEEFDAAIVTTPTLTHTEIIIKLLEAKKHVLVEKPIEYKSEDIEMLNKLAEKNKVIFTCECIERFNPAISMVKNIIEEKKFGDLIMLEFHHEDRVHQNIKDIGIIYQTSIHDIDIANWLFDDMPHVVFAKAGKIKHEHEDFASIMLGYKDDRVAIISSNWITPKKNRTLNAICTNAVISSDFITQKIKIKKEVDIEIDQRGKQEPLLLEIQKFLELIEGKNEQIIKSQEMVNITKIAEAALLSSQKGIPIYLDLK